MDPITQNVNRNIDEYLNTLVAECLQVPSVAAFSSEQKESFAAKVRERLYESALEVLVEKMDESQFSQIENLDPNSPEMVEKIQFLAAQVPGLAEDMEKRFRLEVDNIKQNPQIPS